MAVTNFDVYKEAKMSLYKRLTSEELARKYEDFVYKTAEKFSTFMDLPFDDLVQDSYIGLLLAYDKFDIDLAYQKMEETGKKLETIFKSYAYFYMYDICYKDNNRHIHHVYFPDKMCSDIKKVCNLEEEMKISHPSRNPNEKLELCSDKLNMSPMRIKELLKIHYFYDDMLSRKDEDGRDINVPLLIFDIADDTIDLEMDVLNSILLEEIYKHIFDTLTDRERRVIFLRYGFDDGHEYTFEETAKKFYVTRERIRQIEAKAIRKLRKKIFKNFREVYDERMCDRERY